MPTHIVQAAMSGLGWVDCRKAESLADAQGQETELRADASAWMPGDTDRQTRIVPVAESNCRERYAAKG